MLRKEHSKVEIFENFTKRMVLFGAFHVTPPPVLGAIIRLYPGFFSKIHMDGSFQKLTEFVENYK